MMIFRGNWSFNMVSSLPFLILAVSLPNQTYAQKGVSPVKTELRIEVLAGKGGVGLDAQRWGILFAKLGHTMRVKNSLLGDKPEIKEQSFGTFRRVTVIGQLDRTGKLFFPGGHVFQLKDADKLQEWLIELKTYGSQGAPEGKPLWGLNKVQFELVYNSLSEQMKQDVLDLDLDIALRLMKLPEKYPIRFTTAASEKLKSFGMDQKTRQELNGLSKAAALAIALNEFGLGFRPLRMPAGKIEFVIDPLQKIFDPWPIGWDLKLTRQRTAPKLFQLIKVNLSDLSLKDVLDAITVKAEVPVMIDYYQLDQKQIDLTKIKVSYPEKQTSWSLLLRAITNPSKLSRKIRIDERGQPFVWITTLVPGKNQK